MAFKIPDTPEELFRQANQSFYAFNKWMPSIVFISIVLFFVLTSFYSVDQDEAGIIRRFGKYDRTTRPGLHWKLPFNIERLDKVKVTRVFKEEFGFRTVQPGVTTTYSTKSYEDESIMLTGDLNVIDVTWIIQFRIKDPVAFLFHVRTQRDTVRDVTESVMRQIIGDSSVSEILTISKNEISLEVQKRVQEILDRYESGIQIEKVELQDVNPPEKVKASFNEVNEAEQEREKMVNEAWEKYNQVIPNAKGEAEKTIRQAEGYALARVQWAKGDASKFLQTWEAYKDSKEVTRRRIYLETLEEILPKAGRVHIFDPKANQILPLLNLSTETKKNE